MTTMPFYIAVHRSLSSHSSHRSSSSSSSTSSDRSLRSNDTDSSTTSDSAGTTGANRAGSAMISDTEKRNRLIIRVQFSLLDKSFLNGNIDGSVEPATRTAIKNYRVANGLPAPVRETLDTQLLNSLIILAR